MGSVLRALALAASLALGCAYSTVPGKCAVFALGHEAEATCYGALPEPIDLQIPDGAQRVERREQTIDSLIRADDHRVTTITEPVVIGGTVPTSPPIVAQVKGSAISETFGGVLRLMFRAGWQAVKAIFGAPVP